MPHVIVGRELGSGQLDQFSAPDRWGERRAGCRQPGGQPGDGDGRRAIRRVDRPGVVRVLTLGESFLMVVVGGRMRGQVAMDDRSVVAVRIVRLVCVHVEERRGGRIQLHAETHQQDEAEPVHRILIVADLSSSVKKGIGTRPWRSGDAGAGHRCRRRASRSMMKTPAPVMNIVARLTPAAVCRNVVMEFPTGRVSALARCVAPAHLSRQHFRAWRSRQSASDLHRFPLP